MATYYLNADTGNDSTGAGTSVSPWLTIAKAYSASTAGDTIVLQKATAHYTWATATMATRVLQGATGIPTDAVIDGSAAAVQWKITGTWNISGVRFTNMVSGGSSPFQDNGAASTWTFSNCIFDTFTLSNQCFTMSTSSNSASWTTCLFYNMVPAVGGGLYFIYTTGSFHETWNLTNCTFHFPSGFGTGGGVMLSGTSSTFSMVNCIAYNGGTSIAFQGQGPTYSATYSCFYGFTAGNGLSFGTGCLAATDPKFVDPTNAVFNLQPTSPCIDSGLLL